MGSVDEFGDGVMAPTTCLFASIFPSTPTHGNRFVGAGTTLHFPLVVIPDEPGFGG